MPDASAPRTLDLDALHAALTALPAFKGLKRSALRPMRVKGLAHDHVAIEGPRFDGRPVLLRVPKQSQFGFAAERNLRYQAACFERVSASGHAPRLHAAIPPSPRVPMGALVVDRILGHPPRLPDDLPALVEAMARVHSLPLPPTTARPPLEDHADPVAGILREIEGQAGFLDEAGLAAGSRAEIDGELAWARAFACEAGAESQPITLVLTDTHPGNFLIEPGGPEDGKAVIVDLEKALYGSPAIDLAHATVYSSTTWDPDTWADLDLGQVAGFYRDYLSLAEPGLAAALRPWLVPLRRLLFLRAITWCAKWSVLHRRSRRENLHRAEGTEDWSSENSDPALIAHVADRVGHYLEADTLQRMRAEWLGSNPLGVQLES